MLLGFVGCMVDFGFIGLMVITSCLGVLMGLEGGLFCVLLVVLDVIIVVVVGWGLGLWWRGGLCWVAGFVYCLLFILVFVGWNLCRVDWFGVYGW